MPRRGVLLEIDARDHATPKLKQVSGGVRDVKTQSEKAGPAVRGLGGSLNSLPGPAGVAANALGGPLGIAVAGTAAAGALTSFAVSSLGAARDFQRGMSEIGTLSQDARRNLGGLSDDVRGVALAANQALPDATSAMYDMISAGVDVEQAGEALQTAGKLAVAGVTDISTSTDLLTTAVNAWGSDTLSAERAADVMFATVQRGKTTIDQLGGSLFNVAPVAAAAGVSIEEVGAGAATLTAQGTPTSVAMTQMRNAIVELLKPSEKLAPVWRDAGYASGEAAIEALGFAGAANLVAEAGGNSASGLLKFVGSQEAAQAILGITGQNLATFRDNLDATTDSSGNAEQAFDQMSDTMDFKAGQLQARFDDFKLNVGQALIEPANAGLSLLGVLGDILGVVGQIPGQAALAGIAIRNAFAPGATAFDDPGGQFVRGLQQDIGGRYAGFRFQGRRDLVDYSAIGGGAEGAWLDAYATVVQETTDFTRVVTDSIEDALDKTTSIEVRRRRRHFDEMQAGADREIAAWSTSRNFLGEIAQGTITTAEDFTRTAIDSVNQSFVDYTSTSTYLATTAEQRLAENQAKYQSMREKLAAERAEAEAEGIRQGTGAIKNVADEIAQETARIIQEASDYIRASVDNRLDAVEQLSGRSRDAINEALRDIEGGSGLLARNQDALYSGRSQGLLDNFTNPQFVQSIKTLQQLADSDQDRSAVAIVLQQLDRIGRIRDAGNTVRASSIEQLQIALAGIIEFVKSSARDRGVSGIVGEFQHGGTVPGPIGQRQLAYVHGGERITPPGSPTAGNTFITNNYLTVQGSLRSELDAEDEYLELSRRFGGGFGGFGGSASPGYA